MASLCLEEPSSSPSKVSFEDFTNVDPDNGDNPFLKYLEQDNLDYVLRFHAIIKGFKIQLETESEQNEENVQKILKIVYKRFFRISAKNQQKCFQTLDGFPQDIMEDIIEVAKRNKYIPEMYDKAYAFVADFLENRCFPNFIKSDEFLSSMANLDLSSEDQENKKSKSAETLIMIPNVQPVLEKIPEDKVVSASSAVPTSDLKKQQKMQREAFNLDQIRINPNPYNVDEERKFLASRFQTVQYHEQFDTRKSTAIGGSGNGGSQPRTLPRFSNHKIWKTYNLDEGMPPMNPRQEHAPYHATSSTLNHVSKQNSAFHSIATDTSSAFSTTSDQFLRTEKKQYCSERRKMKTSAAANHVKSNDLMGPFMPEHVKNPEHHSLATKNPGEFFKLLESKLDALLRKQSSFQQFRNMLKRNGHDRMSNPSESVACGDVNDETNESILDDHIGQTFKHEQNEPIRECAEGQTVISYQGSSFQQQPPPPPPAAASNSYAFNPGFHTLQSSHHRQNYAYKYNQSQASLPHQPAASTQHREPPMNSLQQQREAYKAQKEMYKEKARKDKMDFEARRQVSDNNPPLPPRNSAHHQWYSVSTLQSTH